jgi:hypothetical protein
MFLLNWVALCLGYLWLMVLLLVMIALSFTVLSSWLSDLHGWLDRRHSDKNDAAAEHPTQPINKKLLRKEMQKADRRHENDWFFPGD